MYYEIIFFGFFIASCLEQRDRRYMCYADMPKHFRDKIDEERREYNRELAKKIKNTEKETFYLNQLEDYISTLKTFEEELEISRSDYHKLLAVRNPYILKLLENCTSLSTPNLYICDPLAKTLLGFPVKISDNPKFRLKTYENI